MTTGYDDLTERLAADLPYLHLSDFITLRGGGNTVQVIQDPDRLSADAYFSTPLDPSAADQLAAAGWEPPHLYEPSWTRQTPWPPTASDAMTLATAIAQVAHDHLAATPAGLEYNARNYDTGEHLTLDCLHQLRRAAF